MKTMKMIPLFVLALLFAAPAFSQSAACLYLKPGVAYAASVEVVTSSWSSPSTDTFSVGNWRCIDLSKVGDGQRFTLEVQPVAGTRGSCKQAIIRSAASHVPVTFYDTGNLAKGVDCQLFDQP